MSSRKRSRTTMHTSHVKRPIDKQIKAVSLACDTSQNATTLYTCTYPVTITGLRWDLNLTVEDTATNVRAAWAIIVIKDGYSANSIALSNAADFYTPESNVLACGMLCAMETLGAGTTVDDSRSHTKTMRKLQAGDVLQLIQVSNNGTSSNFNGVVQFFAKA